MQGAFFYINKADFRHNLSLELFIFKPLIKYLMFNARSITDIWWAHDELSILLDPR